jgi:hypothetical protein
MKTVFQFVERIAPFFLRFSLALILLWIGALKFADPSPVRGVMKASCGQPHADYGRQALMLRDAFIS